jgi:hypothetical protein
MENMESRKMESVCGMNHISGDLPLRIKIEYTKPVSML